jgi:putative DNA methylase
MQSGDFGDADNLARARGLSVDSVKHAGIVESSAGKVRLFAREELDPDWSPANDTHLTVWECTQYLIRALQDEGEHAAAILLKLMGVDMADAARDLAYRLFDICDKQGRAKEASAYNALIAVWPDLTAQAATITDTDLNQEQLSML